MASIEEKKSPSTSVLVRVPRSLVYFPDDYIHTMEDLSNTMTLRAHLLQKPFKPGFATAYGRAVGSWAAKFHTWGRHPDQEILREVLSEYEEAGDFKYKLSCGRLDAMIEKFPDMLEDRRRLFREVSERISTLVQGGKGGIVHGDFWPGK